MEPSKAVHKENDLTSQKEDIENSSQKIFANNIKLKTLLNHYLTPFLPSLIMGLFITPFFISFVNKMTLLDFLTQMQSAPLSIINRHFTFYIIHFSKEGIVMKVYIASKYIAHKKINNEIYQALKNNGIDAFLPETINNNATDKENMLLGFREMFL